MSIVLTVLAAVYDVHHTLCVSRSPTHQPMCRWSRRWYTEHDGYAIYQGGSMSFAQIIPATPPFDFDLTLRYLHTSPAAIVERVEGRVYQRGVRLDGQPLLLQVSS